MEHAVEQPAKKPWYIEGSAYDLFFIVLAPLMATIAIAATCAPRQTHGGFVVPPNSHLWILAWAPILTYLHVNIGFARSHANKAIFKRHPWRFVAVPVLVVGVLASSTAVMVLALALAVEWDEIHTALQTFGLGRLYDARLGNDPTVGRRLDMGMCLVLEYLPHVILLTYLPVQDFIMEESNSLLPGKWLYYAADIAPKLRIPLYVAGFGYGAVYVFRYWRYVRAGYRISAAKMGLYGSTFISAIIAVTMFTLLEASVMGNIYHAVQYIALVWVTERKNLSSTLNLQGKKAGMLFTFALLIALAGGLAVTRHYTLGLPIVAAIWLTMSLMHYWYDGFIWSVRRKEVPT